MEARYAYEPSSNSSLDIAYLERVGVTDFVHFTPAENLEGILRQGLVPRSLLEGRGASFTGTDSLRLEGRDVVNLSITNPNIRMFYGKRKDLGGCLFSVLILDPALLTDADGAYEFRATNAASRFSQPCSVEELFAGDRLQATKEAPAAASLYQEALTAPGFGGIATGAGSASPPAAACAGDGPATTRW